MCLHYHIVHCFIVTANPVFAVHIAEVLGRIDELKEQWQSYARHQQVFPSSITLCP